MVSAPNFTMALGSSSFAKIAVVLLTSSLAIFTAYLLWSDSTSVVGEIRGVDQASNGRIQGRVRGSDNMPTMSPSPSDATGCKKRLPGAIVIGVMKCGTFALKTFLSSHPGIALRFDKQVNFFSSSNRHPENLEAYRDMMACSTPRQLTMEGSPGYFPERFTPGRIKAALPDVKLILLLRDPVNRSLSEYVHLMDLEAKRGPRPNVYVEMPAIKDGFRREIGPSFKEAVSYPNGSLKTYNLILAKSRYADFLPRWFKLFSRQRILILDGDAFAKDPLPQLKKAEKFLGVRPFFTRRHFVYNRHKGFYCFDAKGLENKECLGKTKGRPHPPIDAALLKRLNRYFAPSVQELHVLLNRTFSWSVHYQDVV